MQALVSGTAGCPDITGLYPDAKCWSQGQECGYSCWQGLSISFLVDEKLLEGSESSDRLLRLAVHPQSLTSVINAVVWFRFFSL